MSDINEPPVQRDLSLLKPEWLDLTNQILSLIKENNLKLRVFETLRTEERQRFLFLKGMSKTMNSKHLLGIATDFVVFDDNNWSWMYKKYLDYEKLGKIVRDKFSDKITWGGEWGWDFPHYEMKIVKQAVKPIAFTTVKDIMAGAVKDTSSEG